MTVDLYPTLTLVCDVHLNVYFKRLCANIFFFSLSILFSIADTRVVFYFPYFSCSSAIL